MRELSRSISSSRWRSRRNLMNRGKSKRQSSRSKHASKRRKRSKRLSSLNEPSVGTPSSKTCHLSQLLGLVISSTWHLGPQLASVSRDGSSRRTKSSYSMTMCAHCQRRSLALRMPTVNSSCFKPCLARSSRRTMTRTLVLLACTHRLCCRSRNLWRSERTNKTIIPNH